MHLEGLEGFPLESTTSRPRNRRSSMPPKGSSQRAHSRTCSASAWLYIHTVSHSTADFHCRPLTRSECNNARIAQSSPLIRCLLLCSPALKSVCLRSTKHTLFDWFGVMRRSPCPSFMRQDGTGVPEEEPRVRKPLGSQIRCASAMQ